MKAVNLFALLLFLCSCAPSEYAIQTAIAETESSWMETLEVSYTDTPKPIFTASPLPPTRTPKIVTRFPIFFETFEDVVFTEWNFYSEIALDCIFPETPTWLTCVSYVFLYKDEASQLIQVIHERHNIYGIVVVDLYEAARKYPEEFTWAFPWVQVSDLLEIPRYSFSKDFFYLESLYASGILHAWLDPVLANLVCVDGRVCWTGES